MNLIKDRILEQRKEKGWTQKFLASAIKTTEDSIYSWEKGRSEPSVDFIISLVKVFDVSADYLLGIKDF